MFQPVALKKLGAQGLLEEDMVAWLLSHCSERKVLSGAHLVMCGHTTTTTALHWRGLGQNIAGNKEHVGHTMPTSQPVLCTSWTGMH